MTRPDPTSFGVDLTIDGKAVAGEGEPVDVYDPASEERIASVPTASLAQVDAAVAAARTAFDTGVWSGLSNRERSRLMHRFADGLEARRDEMVDLIVAEVGCPVSVTRMIQVGMALDHLRFYADAAARDRVEALPPHFDPVPSASLIAMRPVGVAAGIAAFNYPVFLAMSKIGASLAAGCTSVIMPSPLTPLATLLLGQIAREADLPPGVLNVIVGGPDVGRALTSHPGVDKVAFTGSDAVGKQVMQQAAENITGVVLELGGKSPNILLPGSDWDALNQVVHRRYTNHAGQGCGALTRILVPESDVDRFLEGAAAAVESIPVGHPTDPAVVCGPMIRPEARDRVEAAIEAAVARGGEVVAGGGRPQMERGWYTNPTLLAGLAEDDPVCQDELFGPVAVVQTYRDVDDAIRIANNTRYGLNAGIHGPDLTQCLDVAAKLRCGLVSINGGGGFRPDGVFGGFGASGIGREHGEAGIREYLEPQHIQWGL